MRRGQAGPATTAQAVVATLPGPENVLDTRLANGLRALIRPNPASPTVVVEGVVYGGALYEPPDRPGLASFTAGMLDRGTEEHSLAELADELEGIGAEIGFSAGRYTIGFDARCLSEDLRLVLERLAEMLDRPAFPADQVERLRGQILTALQQREDSPPQRAARAFRELAYGPDHPFGREIDGTPDSIAAIGREELVAFHARVVRPAGGVVAVVGDMTTRAAQELLEETLGRWSPPADAPPLPRVTAPPLATGRRETRIEMPGKTQTEIVLGNPAIPRTHPDWLATYLANIVLGVFGLMGRLGENVRDRLGLAYYAYSRLAGGLGPGPWYAVAGVNPSHVDRSIEAILAEMRRLQDEPVSSQELSEVQAFVTGSLPLRLETNAGVARALLDIALYELGLDYLQRFGQLVAAVGRRDIQRAAQTYLHPDRPAVAIAGPPTEAGA